MKKPLMDKRLTEEQREMIERVYPMAKSVASRFYNGGDDKSLPEYSFEELHAICVITLNECALSYDKTRKTKFSTFAWQVMTNKMLDLMRRKKFRYREARGDIEQENNAFPVHFDTYFDGIDVKVLEHYCKEIDQNVSNLPKNAFSIISLKVQEPYAKSSEIAERLGISTSRYNKEMGRIRDWLRRSHRDRAIIEDCCSSFQ